MIFAAIAIYQTARNKYGGRKFLAVLAIAGVSFAAAGLTEVISDVFDLGNEVVFPCEERRNII